MTDEAHHLRPSYTPRFDRAVALAVHDFRRITRKGSRIPYVTHLFAVTGLVGEAGGDEDQLIAAMLHDWLEDVPGATGGTLEEQFGSRVRRIVEGCTDANEHPKPPWHERKQRFVARIAAEPDEVKLVCCADKLHNTSTLVRDLRAHGPSTLSRFRGGHEGTLWYHRAMVEALGRGWDHWLLEELAARVEETAALAGPPP